MAYPKQPRTTFNCLFCNNPFIRLPYQIRKGMTIYCSNKCFLSHLKSGTLESLFWSNVEKTESCWIWTAGKSHGYGALRWQGKTIRAHRFSYELHKGPITKGLFVLHACDNPSCVNPDHLSVGTAADNWQDCLNKGRNNNQNKHKTHCIRGHELLGQNLLIDKKGRRCCRTCKNASMRKNIAKTRGANRAAKRLERNKEL